MLVRWSIQSAMRNQFALRVSSISCRLRSTDAKPAEKKEPKPEKQSISNVPGLLEFFDHEDNWAAEHVRTGRAWTRDELRIKSNSDLHKLWFVLLKERNMLLTWEQAAKEELEAMPSPERLDKVAESMTNLEKVVRERNKAYYELEVGNDGERPTVERKGSLGLVSKMRCLEHFLPRRFNASYNRLNPLPFNNREEESFLRHYREMKMGEKIYKKRQDMMAVKEILTEHVDVDREALAAKYPSIDVEKVHRMLQERHRP